MQITKDTLIGEALQMSMDIAPILLNMGMHCLGCPASQGETIEQACAVHGVDADEIIKQMNEVLAKTE